MKVMIESRFGGFVYISGWMVATGQSKAVVVERDGPACAIHF